MPQSWFAPATLDSGLTVLAAPTGSPSVTAVLMVKTGSRHEAPALAGISHFLEHFVFKGTDKFKTSREAMRYLDSIGADHNAGTGKESTEYWVKAAANQLPRALEFLSEVAFRPTLPARLLAREQGTILQEIAMYQDLPLSRAWALFEEAYFGADTPLGREIIGTKPTVSGLARADLVEYQGRWYHPDNMVLAIAGGVKENDVFRLAERYFGKLEIAGEIAKPFQKTQTTRSVRKSENQSIGESEKAIPVLRSSDSRTLRSSESSEFSESGASPVRRKIETKATDQVHLVMGVPSLHHTHSSRYIRSVMTTIFGGNASSHLFTEIREKRGLAYYVRAGVNAYEDEGFLAVRAGLAADKAAAVEKLVRRMMAEFKATETEVGEAKEFLLGQLALAWEDSHHIASHLAEEYFFETTNPEDRKQKTENGNQRDGRSDDSSSHTVVRPPSSVLRDEVSIANRVSRIRSLADIQFNLKAVKRSEVLELAHKLFAGREPVVAAVGPVDNELKPMRAQSSKN